MLIVKVLAIILGFKVVMAIMDLIDIKLEDRKKGKRKNEGRFETLDYEESDEEDEIEEDDNDEHYKKVRKKKKHKKKS